MSAILLSFNLSGDARVGGALERESWATLGLEEKKRASAASKAS